jgi:hypothetical protein
MNKKYLWIMIPLVAALLAVPATAEDITVTAEVPPYVSVVFNYNTVNFGNVTSGSTDVPAPGQDQGIYNVTVTTNAPLTVSAYRTAWSPSDVLTLKFIDVAQPSDFALVDKYILTTTAQVIRTISAFGTFTDYHGYWLTVPLNAPRGTYSTTVTITYQPA